MRGKTAKKSARALQLSSPFIHDDARAILEKTISDKWISPVGPITEAFEEMIADFFFRRLCIGSK